MSISAALDPTGVRGKLTKDAPLAPLVWFKSGGAAEWLFEPKDVADLQAFLRELDPAVPVMALGLGSNLIVRDGGVAGVVVRLGKAFASVVRSADLTLDCGAGASGILPSLKNSACASAGNLASIHAWSDRNDKVHAAEAQPRLSRRTTSMNSAKVAPCPPAVTGASNAKKPASCAA